MVDLRNKDLKKIVWLPAGDIIFYSLKDDRALLLEDKIYAIINSHIDIGNWRRLYGEMYNDWLNKEENGIYNISDPINLMMINALMKTNKALKNEMIFYWFDIDRTWNGGFEWEYCPLSKKKLLQLEGYPTGNSFISPDYPLVFPTTDRSGDVGLK